MDANTQVPEKTIKKTGMRQKSFMKRQVDEVIRLESDIKAMQSMREAKMKKLEDAMRDAGLDTIIGETGSAEISVVKGRNTTNTDTRAVHKMLSQEEFFEVVKVVRSNLPKVMTQNQIDSVSTVVPGKVGAEKIVIRPF